MPMPSFVPPFCAAGRAMGFYDGAVDQIQAVARFRFQGFANPLSNAASRPTVEAITLPNTRKNVEPTDLVLINPSEGIAR
jgi:hypothetical protein